MPQLIFPRRKTEDVESTTSPSGDPLGITITFTNVVEDEDEPDSSMMPDDMSALDLPTEYSVDDEENLLFCETRISEALGVDVTPLQPLQPTVPSRSLSDIQSIVSDASVYSADKRLSGMIGNGHKEDLSFETLKKIMIGAQVC